MSDNYAPSLAEEDEKLLYNPHYWLYKVTRDALYDEHHPLHEIGHIWNRWMITFLKNKKYKTALRHYVLDKKRLTRISSYPPSTFKWSSLYVGVSGIKRISRKSKRLFRLSEDEQNEILKYIYSEISTLRGRDNNPFRLSLENLEKSEIEWDGSARFDRGLATETPEKAFTHHNKVNFSGFIFPKIDFGEGEFKNKVTFENAIFLDYTSFEGTIFHDDIDFNNAVTLGMNPYKQGFNFVNAEFKKDVKFCGTKFLATTSFIDTKFKKDIDFDNAIFHNTVSFLGAIFNGNVYFKNTTFKGIIDFSGVTFEGETNFKNATFEENTYFRKVEFQGNAFFGDIINNTITSMFKKRVYFDYAKFENAVDFSNIIFIDTVSFERVKYKDVYFTNTQFMEKVDFQNSYFLGDINHFIKTEFTKSVEFTYTTFKERVNFCEAKFHILPNFKGTDFRESINLEKIDLKNIKMENKIELIDIEKYKNTWHIFYKAMQDEQHYDEAIKYFENYNMVKLQDKNTSFLQKIVIYLYSFLASFGSSIGKPLIALGISVLVFSGIYHLIIFQYSKTNIIMLLFLSYLYFIYSRLQNLKNHFKNSFICFSILLFSILSFYPNSIYLSVQNMFPFISDNVGLLDKVFLADTLADTKENFLSVVGITTSLSKNNPYLWLLFPIRIIQILFSTLCLFLFGLGVRNFLRLK